MKKVIYSAALVASLVGLAGCGDKAEDKPKEEKTEAATTNNEEKSSDKENTADTEKKDDDVEESELGKVKNLYINKELNIPIESGSAKATLKKVRYATVEPATDYKALFDDQDIVTLITIEADAENTIEETINFYLNQAQLVTDTGQQVDSDMLLSDDVGGEFLGAVKKDGNIQWVLKHDEDIKKITLHISGASDANYASLSEDLKVEIPFE